MRTPTLLPKKHTVIYSRQKWNTLQSTIFEERSVSPLQRRCIKKTLWSHAKFSNNVSLWRHRRQTLHVILLRDNIPIYKCVSWRHVRPYKLALLNNLNFEMPCQVQYGDIYYAMLNYTRWQVTRRQVLESDICQAKFYNITYVTPYHSNNMMFVTSHQVQQDICNVIWNPTRWRLWHSR